MRRLFVLIMAAALIMLFSGCGGTPPMHYYQLTPTTLADEQPAEKLPDLAIGVGPISIPEMLKRQEIVSRSEDNELRVATQHRWGGLLEKDLTAAIMENLGRQMGTDQVLSFPWPVYFKPDYRVVIDILELTGDPQNLVTLRAGWSLVDGSGEQLLIRKVSSYQQTASEQTVGAMVEAQNQVIAQLSQEISAALRARM